MLCSVQVGQAWEAEVVEKKETPQYAGFKGHGRGRIRTFEGISHQIYSLTPLATWVHARNIRPGILLRLRRGVNCRVAEVPREVVALDCGDGIPRSRNIYAELCP